MFVFSMDGMSGNPHVQVQVPQATPHLVALFCLQFPLILSERVTQNGDFSYYPLSADLFRDHFCFSMRNWRAGRYHTMVTAAAVHNNMNHWFNNFVTTSLKAVQLIPQIGGIMFWSVFAASSVGGALASVLKYEYHLSQTQWQRSSKSNQASANSSPIHSRVFAKSKQILERVSGNGGDVATDSPAQSSSGLPLYLDWDSVLERLSQSTRTVHDSVMDSLFRAFNEGTLSFGASAAVYGLCAFDCGLSLYKLSHRARRIYYFCRWRAAQSQQRQRQRQLGIADIHAANGIGNDNGDDNWSVFDALSRNEWLDSAMSCMQLYLDISRVTVDFAAVLEDTFGGDKRQQSTATATELEHLVTPSSRKIGHSAHVGGFITGVTCFALYHFYQTTMKSAPRSSYYLPSNEGDSEAASSGDSHVFSGRSYQWGAGHQLGSARPLPADWSSIEHI